MSDLDDLSAKLKQYQDQKNESQNKIDSKGQDADNLNNGLRAGAELIVSIIAGGAIGYGLDSWLGTSPLFLILFLLVGVATGFYNVYRITENIGTSVGFAALHKEQKDAIKSATNKTDEEEGT